MGFFDSLKKPVNPEVQLAKESLNLQEKGMVLQGGDSASYEELPQGEARSDLLKWQQELGDEIEKLKHRLRSEHEINGVWVRKTMNILNSEGETIEVEVPAMANEIFIDYIQSQVEPFLSRNLINSSFTEKRILKMLEFTCNDYADAMSDNFDRFSIDFLNVNLIDRLIKNVITPGPFRALSGWTKRSDNTVSKRIEGYIGRPDKEQPPLGGGIFGGK